MTDEAVKDSPLTVGAMTDEELCRLLDGSLNVTVNPAATLAAMPDEPLVRLADGLFRHLDTPSPAFGARFWFLQVTDELRRRRAADPSIGAQCG